MNESVLGVDLGTSSVKILQRYKDGSSQKFKEEYREEGPEGWWEAVISLLEEIDLSGVKGIGLTSQVGTYIVNKKDVYSWTSKVGKEEVEELLDSYREDVFLEEISMVHPPLHSYPLPRLLYFKRNYKKLESVYQPKEVICERLTGNRVTDPFSWRGLANTLKKEYSTYFLEEVGISPKILPKIRGIFDVAGYTGEVRLGKGILPSGIPVFLGLNDFYASLIGMGLQDEMTLFDITGTSEHLGRITEKNKGEKGSITSPYLFKNVNYGVTSSSGGAIKKALKSGVKNIDLIQEGYPGKAPVCLPYLNGERAPVFNPDARGILFGIEEKTSQREIYHAFLEGVVFGLYHIYESMGLCEADRILVSGGAGEIELLNRLKAEIFRKKIEVLEETDTSALGAVMIAAVGSGWYKTLEEAQKKICRIKHVYQPTGNFDEIIRKRYQIYKKLYPSVRQLFGDFKELNI